MNTEISDRLHTFHIPVMGTAFTIDSPVRVAPFGITSVISIGDDELCEEMRMHYTQERGESYTRIEKDEDDYRARRITAYLNLVDTIINERFEAIKSQPFGEDNDLKKYFDMLPDSSNLKKKYVEMTTLDDGDEKKSLQSQLKDAMRTGYIEVNIMTKLDRNNYDKEGNELPLGYSDALAAVRGYAESNLRSGIVFSAGFNRRLYAYMENFDDFYPDETGDIKKKVVMKVSDYRSSLTQGKFLAKKGIWISEHRIESGLNCGGHAFASDGFLLGPILDEMKQNKVELSQQLLETCNEALSKKGKTTFATQPELRVTVQGGIGTYNEDQFLMDYFQADGTGWATPFLLVPEATIVEDHTRQLLLKAEEKDLYTSPISPLGIPFNTIRGTESEKQKLERFDNGRPGSPCPKAHLVSNMEFSKKPVCTASIFYQKRKIEELKNTIADNAEKLKAEIRKVIEKACLCEDLAAPALLENDMENGRPLKTAVCPGPNLAYFSKIASLKEMVDHIYGRVNLLNDTYRPNMFIKELKMYIEHFGSELKSILPTPTDKQIAYIETYKANLEDGIEFYRNMIPELIKETQDYRDKMAEELNHYANELNTLFNTHKPAFSQASNA